jgi:DNA-binding transcriptional LysR family regulator
MTIAFMGLSFALNMRRSPATVKLHLCNPALQLCVMVGWRVMALNWDDVPFFLALVRAANLHEAAAQLNVDKSTVSRRIALLERALGGKLFARTREGLRPTLLAQRLGPHAERIAADMSALRSAAAVGEERPRGSVRLATTEGLATLLIEAGLLQLHDDAPEIELHILAGNKPLDLARGEADLALRLSVVREASLRVRCVARAAVGLFAAPEYLRTRGRPRTTQALAGHDVLLAVGELARLPESRWLEKRRDLRVVLRSNSMPALVAAAVAGRGLVAMGLGWGDRHPGLERVLVLENVPRRPIWLVTSEREPPRAAVRVVADRIAALFARGQI